MKGCGKEYIWKYDNSKLICGLNKWFCPECSKSKSELDKLEDSNRKLPPVLTPTEKAINWLNTNCKKRLNQFPLVCMAIDIAIQEQRKEELELLLKIRFIIEDSAQHPVFIKELNERIKQLEAKE